MILLRLMRGAAMIYMAGRRGARGGDGREREREGGRVSENINQFSSKYKSELVP
jgi:hypothetical protein